MNKKLVLILGASSDIGLSITKKFVEEGYQVLAHYNKGNKNFTKYIKNTTNVFAIKFNFITTNNKIEKFLKNKKILKADIFINALGYIKPENFKNINLENFEKTLKVNFYPSFILTKNLGLKMCKKKWGRIVHISSIGVKFGGGENNYYYSLSKHCLEFFPSYTKKWVQKNVLINTIRVGATDTKLHKKLPKKNLKERAQLIPAKRMAKVREISDFIYGIASEKNTYISNQILTISGGE